MTVEEKLKKANSLLLNNYQQFFPHAQELLKFTRGKMQEKLREHLTAVSDYLHGEYEQGVPQVGDKVSNVHKDMRANMEATIHGNTGTGLNKDAAAGVKSLLKSVGE